MFHKKKSLLFICFVLWSCSNTNNSANEVKVIADEIYEIMLEDDIALRMKFGLPITKFPDMDYETARLKVDQSKKFIKKMNKYSSIMGLKNTNFANPHGLPNKANLSSALDMFILSSKIINDYPQYLHRFKKTRTKIKDKTYKTHNKLLKKYDHYIGLKTGYIRKSGFQISLLRESNDQYLLGIYFGGNSANERNNKINYLMNKYFNKPETKVIIESSKKTDLKKNGKSSCWF